MIFCGNNAGAAITRLIRRDCPVCFFFRETGKSIRACRTIVRFYKSEVLANGNS